MKFFYIMSSKYEENAELWERYKNFSTTFTEHAGAQARARVCVCEYVYIRIYLHIYTHT